MWEVITGETPFSNRKVISDADSILEIINGYRPKIYKYIPYEYATLMKQFWDANPDNRPDGYKIWNKMRSLIELLYNGKEESTIQFNSPKSNSLNFSQSSLTNNKSKVYTFSISAQPKNATEEEQLAYETKQFDLEIPEVFGQLSLNDNVDNLNNSQAD
ncbi:hypothetical protein Glove_346g185 [Diversispora epigaea]|uniref:Serine-threonine/tyrosine-protein kinase catalytic domain-containing protein n=1 Tax=Diversispora epigaea TaxID=1348612 RepID=A0A397HFE1_9GLOM|nr:hypothetical protein Glove_346g185 [Diversispora epigaea]